MTSLVHELIINTAQTSPDALALQVKDKNINYKVLSADITAIARAYLSLNIEQGDRIGIYLAKTCENVEAMFACGLVGGVFVPINPVLKAKQVQHIIDNCQVKVLITNTSRLKSLQSTLVNLPSIEHIILTDWVNNDVTEIDNCSNDGKLDHIQLHQWKDIKSNNDLAIKNSTNNIFPKVHENQLAAILYTSGSTGKPKGIMLSHKNIVLGAKSVSQYLENTHKDKLLALLPLSFDYGLSQLTTSFLTGGTCVLLDYLFANDVLKAIDKYKITGLAGVPPLWAQLIKAKWSANSTQSLRYFTNSGGALSSSSVIKLRNCMPQVTPYLMYGLTEAFRSTYLPPNEIDNKIGSIGKAIPNAEVMVLRTDGTECQEDEIGELVHIGPLVSMGYWQNSEATSLRFKTTPSSAINNENSPLAVFSGDFVKRDHDGFLYFVARQDEMIKTSGYRVSPSEVEEIILQHPLTDEVVVMGIEHSELGQGILCIVCVNSTGDSSGNNGSSSNALLNSHNGNNKAVERILHKHCMESLATYMVPKKFIVLSVMPKNPNGKLDRNELKQRYQNCFQ